MSSDTIAILWGSETGTAQCLAETAEIKLKENGFSAKEMDMSDVKLEQLKEYSKVLVVTSTWGDGDPPSNAYDLLEALQSQSVDLSHLSYSVCALGDRAYYQFCKCGKDFDAALESKGAKRFYPLQECDIDYEAPFEEWLQGVMAAIKN
jgi:sulfite reductase alpha subunit-like flavoprotein